MSGPIDLLRRCVTPAGFVAAIEERANYRRIWSRDGCVCGLAALLSGDPELVDGLRATLRTLREHQGPSGQTPSNVNLDGSSVSFGGTAGRVDATLWYLLMVCLHGRLAGDDGFVEESWPSLERAVRLLRAWEFNDGGLLYVPQAGDWADEYVLSGYLLYDQVLRQWALRELDAAGARLGQPIEHEREGLALLIASHFDPAIRAEANQSAERPARRGMESSPPLPDEGGKQPYFHAGFHAGARYQVFDGLGNALAILLGLGRPHTRRAAFRHAKEATRFELVPAFDPPIGRDDPNYEGLRRAAAFRFRNKPGRYQNGGLWPMVTGFWTLAARQLGEVELAERWQAGITRANALGEHGYPEYLDARTGAPGGVRGQAWSAAAEILAGADPRRLTGP